MATESERLLAPAPKSEKGENEVVPWRRRSFTLVAIVAAVGITMGTVAWTTSEKKGTSPNLKASLNHIAENSVSDQTDSFCIAARNENYDALPKHTLQIYNMELLLEPAVTNVLTISYCDTGASMDDFTIQWVGNPYGQQDTHFSFVDGVDDASEVKIMVEPANSKIDLEVTVTSISSGETFTLHRRSDVRIVRRELRTLTDDDREAYFEAVHTVFTTDEKAGKELYGDAFTSHDELAALHNSKYFMYHGNLFFQTSHPAMQMRFERSLRAVNPSVVTPYWDFLIDSKLGSNWTNAIVYDKAWFGPVKNDLPTQFRSPGRFHDVKRTYDKEHEAFPSAWHSPYGFISSYTSTNKSPWMTRSSNVCGFELQQGFANCEHVSTCFDKFLAQNRSMIEYDLCMEHYVHANLHDMHAGMWDCEVDWQEYFDENKDWLDRTLLSVLAVKMVESIQTFANNGTLQCPLHCDLTTDTIDSCACRSADESVLKSTDVDHLEDDVVNQYVRTIWDSTCKYSYGANEVAYFDEGGTCKPKGVSSANLASLNRLILKTVLFPGNYGDMASGAAANDPLFWVMHQIFDKAAHALRLSPVYNRGGFQWDQYGDDPTMGQGWNSETPFNYEDFEPYVTNYNRSNSGKYLTNKELWSMLSPNSDAIPYVYDEMSNWGNCYFDPMSTSTTRGRQ